MKLKPFEKLFIIHLEIQNGRMRFKNAFEIWKFIMTHDIKRLHKQYCGLNAFDEFYSTLNNGGNL